MSELTTFIPAGGLGSRLRPHTLDTPKPMLLMGSSDRRVIDGPLEVSVNDSAHTWVSTDYLAEQLHDYLEGMSGVTALRDSATIGSAGSLFEHYKDLSSVSSDGDMLILPSDHIYEGFSVSKFWEKHQETAADITLLTVPRKLYGEYATVDGHDVLSIEKDFAAGEVSTTGIFIVKNNYLMEWLSRARQTGKEYNECNIYRDIICPAVGRAAVAAYSLGETDGYWEDTGTPARYLDSNMRLSGGENVISTQALIGDDVRLEHCVVLGDAVIHGPIVLRDAIISSRNSNIAVTTGEADAA